MHTPVHNLCCMISGGGRTALNLQDAIDRGELGARIVLVISSDSEAPGVARCAARGLKVVTMAGTIPREELLRVLREHKVECVALAGYLKLLRLPKEYEGRVVNIHPALLPKYGGKGMFGHHVHEAVLRAGEKQSGCTVHLVDATYDTGRVLLQATCPVLPKDTPDTLAARVFEAESKAYPAALRALLETLAKLYQ